MYSDIYTSEVKSLIYCDMYIKYLYTCVTVIEDDWVIYIRKEKSYKTHSLEIL